MKIFKREAKSTDVTNGDPAIESNKSSIEHAEKQNGDPTNLSQAAKPKGFYQRLRVGLSRTRNQIADGLTDLLKGKVHLDEDVFEALEERLLISDVGVETTGSIMELLAQNLKRPEFRQEEPIVSRFKSTLIGLLEEYAVPLSPMGRKPFVILVVGVNGAGKTTTIGKLAYRFQRQGLKVMLAAGDTFRAAAVDQLQEWGDQNGVPVISQGIGADSASVIYDAIESASSRGFDILLADTAGRLQNKSHLMDELSKVKRVMNKFGVDVPHETLLVLDATTGQNGVSQAIEFDRAVGVSGVALTKLDGTAKGGVIFAIAAVLKRPIRLIGIGEQLEDLRDFHAGEFVDAMLDLDLEP